MQNEKKATVIFLLSIFLLHLAIAILFTRPMISNFDTKVPGTLSMLEGRPYADSWFFLWNVWWFHEAVKTGQNPWKCPLLFYPKGAELYFNTMGTFTDILSLPFVELYGLVPAANIGIILTLALSGLAATLLGWEITHNKAGSLITGLSFGQAPFVYGRLQGHWNLTATAPFLLTVWLLVRLLNQRSFARAMTFGLGLAVLAYCEYVYLAFAFLLTGLLSIASVAGFGPAGSDRKNFIARLFLSIIIFLFASFPLLYPSWSLYRSGGEDVVARERLSVYSADLMEYVTPNLSHPLIRNKPWMLNLVRDYRLNFEARRLWIGAIVLFLSLMTIFYRNSISRFDRIWWLMVVLVGLVLSLGDHLRILGRETIPLPYSLIEYVPVFRYLRAPGRFSIFVQLGFSVLAGFGTREIFIRRGLIPVIVFSAFILFEFLPAPIPLVDVKYPDLVKQIKTVGNGPIWDLGVGRTENLLYQTEHGMPIVGGFYARVRPEDLSYSVDLKRMLRRAIRGAAGAEEAIRASLKQNQVAFILLSPNVDDASQQYLRSSEWTSELASSDGWYLLRID